MVGVECLIVVIAAYIMDIYKCFGIIFPRNTNQQEISTGRSIMFSSPDDPEPRLRTLDNLVAGSLLYMKNHVLMYLGKGSNGNHYAINALYAYGDISKPLGNGRLDKKIINCVTVIPLDLPVRRNGRPFYDNISSVLQVGKNQNKLII